jgi:hypothetical protein
MPTVHIADDHNDNWAQGFYDNMLRFPVEQSFHAARNAKVTLDAGSPPCAMSVRPDFVDVALRNAINAGITQGRACSWPATPSARPAATATARRFRPSG